MKKALLIALLVLVCGALVGVAMKMDPGYVRASYGNYLVETSIWVALVGLLLLLVLFWLAVRLLAFVITSLTGHNPWISNYSHLRAQRKTTQGLLQYAEGNWGKAQRYLTSAAPNSDLKLINYLAAAQAASEQGHEKDSDRLLKKAYESTPGSEMAVGITQAQLQLARNELEPALATLVHLRKRAPHHPFVLKLLHQVYLRLQDWPQLAQLLPELKKQQTLKPEELKSLERVTWLHLLQQAADECYKQGKGGLVDVENLNRVWDRLPRSMREDDTVIGAYAEHLARLGHEPLAETVLRKVLRNHWSDLLANLYGRVQGQNVSEQLQTAESWLKNQAENPVLLLTLGRLSLRNELWGKARDYFEASLKLRKTRETYAELCRLMAHLGYHERSTEYFIQGLLEESGLPNLPMPRERPDPIALGG